MTPIRKHISVNFIAIMALLLSLSAAQPALASDDLSKVLAKLDASAAKFKSAQADILWDNVQTQPFEDSDKQAGTILLERKKGQVEMALHFKTDNGKPIQKDMVYADGVGKLYSAKEKTVQVFKLGDKQSQLDSLLSLGFGGSGQDLQKNWTVTYIGTETVGGVSAAKLQLVPRDPSLAQSTPKVFLWIDTDKGVAVKQQRFDASGNYLVFAYSNIRINASLPSGAFDLKPPAGTQIVNHQN